ncbi:ribonuclease H-like domain-containing protein [Fomes fomentarius]|nr:ribonuclease H-like domain-containing protein [Fomes fomentarius]
MFHAQVMKQVGIDRFSAVCSDNTGNTRKARELLAKEIPGLLNLLDVCHHLHNTAKDITALIEFKVLIANLRDIIKYFRKSTIASTELTILRLQDGVSRGLESIGKTRFATVYWAAESVKRCLPQLQQLMDSGKVPLKKLTFDPALLKSGRASMQFEQDLDRYISILAPFGRAIKSLEATDTTAGDVYIFWLAIAATLHDLFALAEEHTGITRELAQKVTSIVNRRYKEVIDESPTDVYFSSCYLNPKYARADVLGKPTSMSNAFFLPPPARTHTRITSDNNDQDDSKDAPNPRAYRRVKEFLKILLRAEVDKGTTSPLMAYARGEWPFQDPLGVEGERPVLNWWLNLEKHPHARVLAMLTIKLYLIAVNSMADERTASNFTWFNLAIRNRQEVRTLVDMIQVRQWYLHKDTPRPPRTSPAIKWMDIDKKMFQKRDAIKTELNDNEFFMDWPSKGTQRGSSSNLEVLLMDDEFDLDDIADLQSKMLKMMLCDKQEEEEDSDVDDGTARKRARLEERADKGNDGDTATSTVPNWNF